MIEFTINSISTTNQNEQVHIDVMSGLFKQNLNKTLNDQFSKTIK